MIYLMAIVYAGNVFISCAPCKEIMNKIIMFCEWKKCRRYGKAWKGMGRCGKAWKGAERCKEVRRDMERI